MNPFRIKSLLIALSVGFVFISCQKDKISENGCSISMQNLSGTYKMTDLKYKLNSAAAEQDYRALMDACEKDDFIILNSNGTSEYRDAGTSCVPSQSSIGTWSVNGNTLTSDGTLGGTISSFDCKTLVFYITDVYTAGDKLVCTIVKQ